MTEISGNIRSNGLYSASYVIKPSQPKEISEIQKAIFGSIKEETFAPFKIPAKMQHYEININAKNRWGNFLNKLIGRDSYYNVNVKMMTLNDLWQLDEAAIKNAKSYTKVLTGNTLKNSSVNLIQRLFQLAK